MGFDRTNVARPLKFRGLPATKTARKRILRAQLARAVSGRCDSMKPFLILAIGALILLAWLARYEIVPPPTTGGAVIRLDRWTGAIVVCVALKYPEFVCDKDAVAGKKSLLPDGFKPVQ
jgi:hypothetical protein